MTCPYCGGRMIWGSSCMANERVDGYEDEDTAVIDYYRCDTCGRDYEIVEPNETERETEYRAYWNGKKPTQNR